MPRTGRRRGCRNLVFHEARGGPGDARRAGRRGRLALRQDARVAGGATRRLDSAVLHPFWRAAAGLAPRENPVGGNGMSTTIESVLNETRVFEPSPAFVAQAHLTRDDYY